MNNYHKSVLLQEAIDALNIEKGKKYIDATLGGAGHSLAIIDQGGIVLGIDQDEEAVEFANKNHESRIMNHELVLARGNFCKHRQDCERKRIWKSRRNIF